MFLFSTKEIEMDSSKNAILSKKIEIDENLNCFIVLSSNNKKILTPLLNKIVDYILDNISLKDTYNKFSVTLESINFFIKNVKKKEDNLDDLSIVIGILEKNNFHFSKVGEASAYLINRNREFLEISDPSNKIQEFDFISTGKLIKNEKIILSNKRISDYLTQSDLEELSKLNEIEEINNNIINVMNDEKIEDNVQVVGFDFNAEGEVQEKKVYIERTKNLFYKSFDNNISKKSIALFLVLKEKIEKRGKITKNIVFVLGIFVCVFLLYSILSSIVGKTIEGGKTTEYKNYLIQARDYIRIANENLANPENFDINIKKAEDLVAKVKKENLFLNDVNSISDDISIIKKQFNGIESFEGTANNMLFKGNFSDGVKLLELDKKLYAVGKSSIYGPIVQGQDIKTNIFEELEIDDEFIDGTVAGTDIILMTKKGRVVSFGKDSKFKYINVLGQKAWEESSFIESYNGNLYLANKDGNQVYMHSPAQSGFNTGVGYLSDADMKNIGKVISVGIDGGIYMLKSDLSLIKFFRSPKYKIQSIVLNKLPKNYSLEGKGATRLITKPNLSYVYLLLNNKIWIFEPNTKVSSDTKSLTYIGQVEGKSESIISFNVPRDNEVEVMTKSGIYKLGFEIKDGKLIIR